MADQGALSRRSFIRLAGGAAGVALLSEACVPQVPNAPAGAPTSSAATKAAGPGAVTGGITVKLPTYLQLPGLAPPDLAGSADGIVPPAYFNYPRPPLKSVAKPIGNGEEVNAMMYTTQAPPTPMDNNTAWQQVNKELGVTMKLPLIQLADYTTKLNTTIASGNLPDLLSLGAGNGQAIQNLPEFLSQTCADLTQFASGDAVKEYPNLANLPSFAWRNAVFNDRIYAVPVVRTSVSAAIMFAKGRVLEPVTGVTFKNADDFLRVMKDLTQPSAQQWGLGATSGGAVTGVPGTLTYFLESFGAPNVWREQNGKLTKDWETEEFKAALGFMRNLWQSGVMHPDTPTATVNQAAQNFYAGRTVLWQNGFTIGDVAWNRAYAQDANFGMRGLAPFSHDGTSKPVHHLGPGAALLTVIKKGSQEYVRKMLNVLNYFSAPFGTAEFLLIWYGIEGDQFQFDTNGNPAVSDKGQTDLFIPWPNIGSPSSVLYNARTADYARVMHQDAMAILWLGIQNPVVGLYSKTNAQRAASLNQAMADGLTNIIFGRAELSSLDQLVKDWRSQGGDQIRTEYEQTLQASRS
jgi:putative aldouronate transport system substrate-binding protein